MRIFGILLSLAVGAPAATAGAQEHHPLVQQVLSHNLWLRSAPRYDATPVALLPKGTLVCVVRVVEHDWYEVRIILKRKVVSGFVARGFTGDPPGPVPPEQIAQACGGQV